MKFAGQNNIICSEQHELRQDRSCETQLLAMDAEITYDLERALQTDLLFIDFSKAIH